MPKKVKGEQAAVLTPPQFKRLLKMISTTTHAKRDTLLMLISFGLGLRAIEIANLRIKNVLTPAGKIIEEVALPKTKNDQTQR